MEGAFAPERRGLPPEWRMIMTEASFMCLGHVCMWGMLSETAQARNEP